jgi:cobalamin biosynthetic protein CobC
MRDHGGNLDWAIARFGGTAEAWIDLSTGINRVPYPVPDLPASCWSALPTASAMAGLIGVAADAYGTGPGAAIAALAGAQAAIQMIPRLWPPGTARVLGPTYSEHAATLRGAGWQVTTVTTLADLAGADLAVVVNPNNPDGRAHAPESLLRLAGTVGRLIVDESFADAAPRLSLVRHAGQRGLVLLRSFGKFYGLAGLRLGFVIGHPEEIAAIRDMAGPWPISGSAIEIGRAALSDRAWAAATARRLAGETRQMDLLAAAAGWRQVGGTALFRLYETGDGAAAQARLAQARIWSRRFDYAAGWHTHGQPGGAGEGGRVRPALEA